MWWIVGAIIILMIFRSANRSDRPTKKIKYPSSSKVYNVANPSDWKMKPEDAKQALEQSRTVWIKYRDAKGVITEREVDIYAFDGFDFQVFDHKRKQIREFLFERVVDFRLIDKTFERNPGIASRIDKRNAQKNVWKADVSDDHMIRCPNCGTTISLEKIL